LRKVIGMKAKKNPSSENGTTRAPLVSIVIPVFNKVEFTKKCLNALRAHTATNSYELIMVDNASRDQTPHFLNALRAEADHSPCQIIRNQTNVGFVHACNQGAALAKGKYLLFLNNDTQVREGWLEALVALAESDEKVGAVGAKLVYPNGILQEAGGIIFSDGSGWNFGKGDDPKKNVYNQACEVDYCSGACLLVRRNLFEKLHGFDARYAPAYYEDVDLCFGIRRLGYKVMYSPQAEIVHYEGITAGTQTTSGIKQYQVRNQQAFYQKWREQLLLQEPNPEVNGERVTTADRERLAEIVRSLAWRKTARRGSNLNILVVDPTLPLFDKQAGSLRLFNLLKLFRHLGCNVTYIARDGYGPDRYTRVLQSLGIDTYLGREGSLMRVGFDRLERRVQLRDLLAKNVYHLAWISFYHAAEEFLPVIRERSPETKIIIDTVDLHFVREKRQAEVEGSKARLAAAQETRHKELAIYRQADALITVTREEQAVLAKHGIPPAKIKIIPIIFEVEPLFLDFQSRSGILFVGNFNHLPNLDAVKYFCTEVFPRVLKRLPDLKLTIIGSHMPKEIQRLAAPQIVVTGYVPVLKPYLQQSRLSIAILRFGAGMKGKIVEAMSCGLPVLTTSVGAEGMGLKDGWNVLIRNDAAGMAEAVVNLYNDEHLWKKLSQNGQAHVRQHFTPAAILPVLRSILAGVKMTANAELGFLRERVRRYHETLWESLVKAPEASAADFQDNRTANLMYNSKILKIAKAYYEIRDFILPVGTWRGKVFSGLVGGIYEFFRKIYRWINKT
jgi:O-antigen biosynthesis protein